MEKKKRKTTRGKHTIRRSKASAADVLGRASAVRPIPPKWREQYNRLIELRDYLLNRKGVLAKDALEEKPTYSMHMGDAGTDEFDRDFALSMISSEQGALYEIEQALIRIRQGT